MLLSLNMIFFSFHDKLTKLHFYVNEAPPYVFVLLKNRKEMPKIKKIQLHVFLNLATNFY